VGKNVIFYLELKFEQKDCFLSGDSETEHLLPSEMPHVDFGLFSSVNVVKGRAELLPVPVPTMGCVKEGLP